METKDLVFSVEVPYFLVMKDAMWFLNIGGE